MFYLESVVAQSLAVLEISYTRIKPAPNQQTSTLKETLCSNRKGYFWFSVVIFSKIACIEGNVYYEIYYHFWSLDPQWWTCSLAVATDDFMSSA